MEQEGLLEDLCISLRGRTGTQSYFDIAGPFQWHTDSSN
jgi:hypothetical protein